MFVDKYKHILDFKGFVSEPVQQLIELLQDSELKAFLNQLGDTEQLPRFTEMVR
jgi:hypothetical protein